MAACHPVPAERLKTSAAAARSRSPLPRTTLLDWIGEDRAVADVAAYFGSRSTDIGSRGGPNVGPAYSGSRFEALAGVEATKVLIEADTSAAAIEQLRAQLPADHLILYIRLTDRQAPAA